MKKEIIKFRKQGLTIREIMKKTGLKSTSAVWYHLEKERNLQSLRVALRLIPKMRIGDILGFTMGKKHYTVNRDE